MLTGANSVNGISRAIILPDRQADQGPAGISPEEIMIIILRERAADREQTGKIVPDRKADRVPDLIANQGEMATIILRERAAAQGLIGRTGQARKADKAPALIAAAAAEAVDRAAAAADARNFKQ
jgi:hypothetical protein